MYTHIVNPKTNRKINVLGRSGLKILREYVDAFRSRSTEGEVLAKFGGGVGGGPPYGR